MPERLKYSIIMFVAGSSYGFIVPLVRTAQISGFSTGQIMVAQYLVATVALSLFCLIFSRRRVSLKDIFKLIGIGIVAAGVSFFYYQALERTSPATSLTLLFQFVWMGMVFQAVHTRTPPRLATVITVLLVVVGAVFATGLLDEGVALEGLDPTGILFGLLAAVCYTAFLVLSGRVATAVPAVNRGMFVSSGALIVSLAIAPQSFTEPLVVISPLIGVALGLLGFCVPSVLTALCAPKLPTSLTTVMASSELPSGVICAAIFLGEPVSFTIGLGVVVVLFGIVVSEFESLRMLRRKNKNRESGG